MIKKVRLKMTYQEIIDIIKRTGETPENLWVLGCWFQQYGNELWIGECYNTEKKSSTEETFTLFMNFTRNIVQVVLWAMN